MSPAQKGPKGKLSGLRVLRGERYTALFKPVLTARVIFHVIFTSCIIYATIVRPEGDSCQGKNADTFPSKVSRNRRKTGLFSVVRFFCDVRFGVDRDIRLGNDLLDGTFHLLCQEMCLEKGCFAVGEYVDVGENLGA